MLLAFLISDKSIANELIPIQIMFATHQYILEGARDLVLQLLGEKGLGDEGARYLYNARPISLLA